MLWLLVEHWRTQPGADRVAIFWRVLPDCCNEGAATRPRHLPEITSPNASCLDNSDNYNNLRMYKIFRTTTKWYRSIIFLPTQAHNVMKIMRGRKLHSRSGCAFCFAKITANPKRMLGLLSGRFSLFSINQVPQLEPDNRPQKRYNQYEHEAKQYPAYKENMPAYC